MIIKYKGRIVISGLIKLICHQSDSWGVLLFSLIPIDPNRLILGSEAAIFTQHPALIYIYFINNLRSVHHSVSFNLK